MTTYTTLGRAAALVGAAAMLSGCWLFSQYDQMKEADSHFRNEGVRVNVRTVALALQMYARDHRGAYPGRTTWISDLARGYYLPNNRLPPNPWVLMDEHTQASAPALAPLPTITDDGPFDPAAPGTIMGKGERPTQVFYKNTTFGAILYDVTPGRRMCVIYGVGQQGEDAVIIESQVRGRPMAPAPTPTPAPPKAP